MYPILFQLGPLTIYSYGAMMALAFLTAGWLTGRELGRHGHDPELASSLVVWAAAGGLLGARVWSVINDWQGFLDNPIHAIFSGAGFVFYGGLIGGFLAVTWAMRRYQLPFLTTIDCIAPGLALAHGIGRVGCELAGDGDWGTPSTLPWAHSYPNAIIGWNEWTAAHGYPPDIRVHPTPLYELLAYSIVFAALWSMRKKLNVPGSVFWLYLILAPAARFLIEFIRVNPPVLWGLSQAQFTSLALIAIGAWRLAINTREPQIPVAAVAARTAKR